MTLREVNFDGLIGPTHNYAGLAEGNLASAANEGAASRPRAAALQGLEKMRLVLRLGVMQGFFPPPLRPSTALLGPLGYGSHEDAALAKVADEDPLLLAALLSGSSMWTANAATVVARPDSGDGRVHVIVANRATALHRSIEAAEQQALFATLFGDAQSFALHPPLPAGPFLADEGAANHMRLAAHHGAPGVNIFVVRPDEPGRFPGRQHPRASHAVARLAGCAPERTIFVPQSRAAVDAGAFHNDVVAVANERVLLFHPQAYDDPDRLAANLARLLPDLVAIPVAGITLAEAVDSYLFNSQLLTRPDGGMTLLMPAEIGRHAAVTAAVDTIVAADNPIDQALTVAVDESMRNGGGPACLRLRVPLNARDISRIDQRFLLDEKRIDRLAALVERHWPERIAPTDLADPALWAQARAAHAALDALIGPGW